MKNITFGTSGFRGIINKDFNLENIKKIALAIAKYLKENHQKQKIAIGYDPRHGNDPKLTKNSFTHILCETLTDAGIHVDFFSHYVPTPFVSWYVKESKCQGALILTASHNPPEYNGIKFNDENGAPSSINITKKIEKNIENIHETITKLKDEKKGTLNILSPPWNLFAHCLKNEIQKLNIALPKEINLTTIIDCKHGTAAPLWKALSETFQIKHFHFLHQTPCPNFNFIDTNPCNTQHLEKLKESILSKNADLGIANDPDADRHIILDEKGLPLTPEESALIIYDFLKSQKIKCHSLISTLASSSILKSASQIEKFTYQECCVGFKFIAEKLLKENKEKKYALGIESSGGFSSSFHTLEKCGFLPGILIILALSITKEKLSTLKDNVIKKYGRFFFHESSSTFDAQIKPKLENTLKKISQNELQTYYPINIINDDKRDGLKVNFSDNAWTLLRFSGTEALIRIYAESNNNEEAKSLINASNNMIQFLCQKFSSEI